MLTQTYERHLGNSGIHGGCCEVHGGARGARVKAWGRLGVDGDLVGGVYRDTVTDTARHDHVTIMNVFGRQFLTAWSLRTNSTLNKKFLKPSVGSFFFRQAKSI